LSEKETTHLLARVGSTSRAMDLLVKNVLDMYLLEEDNLQPHPRVIDPNVIVQEVADVYGREARLKGLRMRTELGWKLYIARALTETNGGTVSARSHTNRGLTLITEVPFWEP